MAAEGDRAFILLGGYSGSGKTTLLRALIQEHGKAWTARTKAEGSPSTGWLELEGKEGQQGVCILGRWSGHHRNTGGHAAGGKVDGCDRIHASGLAVTRSLFQELRARNFGLIIGDGPRMMNDASIIEARRWDYNFRLIEVSTPKALASNRKRVRESNEHSFTEEQIAQCSWDSFRPRFKEYLEPLSQKAALAELRRTIRLTLGKSLPAGPVIRKPAAAPDKKPKFLDKLSEKAKERRRAFDRKRKSAQAKAMQKKPALHQKFLKRRRERDAKTAAKGTPEIRMLESQAQFSRRWRKRMAT